MNVTSQRGRYLMNDEQLQQMTDRIAAGDHAETPVDSLEDFCIQIMDAAPQMRPNFQQELEMRLLPVHKPMMRLNWSRPARMAAMLAIALFAVVAVVYAID